jgi:DNA-binding CsgD family transcriptional regulator
VREAPASLRVADVVGREAELARIGAFLADASGGACAVLLHGEPGVGKTTLWRQSVHDCRKAGYEVLQTRPAEEERSLALAGLVDLFEGVVDDAVALAAAGDSLARGHATLAALSDCLRRGPVLIAIDDLQWLDTASVRALRFALRRIAAEPVAVLATTRPGARDPLGLMSLLPPSRIETLVLGPLGLPELRRVVGQVVTTLTPLMLRRIHEVSGGNPLFALELARAAAASGDVVLPRSLQAAVGVRLDAVPERLVPLLEITSALVRTSVGELGDLLPQADAGALVALARELELLALSERGEVRFSHPLIGSVVYERMSPLTRRALHARLALHVSNPDACARHLALSSDEPDPALARRLASAARRAGDRGELGLAAELAEHSVRLTPAADDAARLRHALARIRFLAAAGELSRAAALSDRLLAGLAPGPARAEALVQRAQLEDDDLERGASLLMQALQDAGDDASLRGRVLDQLGRLRGLRGDLAGGIACAREALAVAEATGDRAFEMSAAAGVSNLETLAGSPRPDLMERAVALEDEIGRPPLWPGPRVLRAEQLLWSGDLRRARALLEAAVDDAARRNHERWLPCSLYALASVEAAAGELGRADALLRQAMDVEDAHVESWIVSLIATWTGRTDVAREAAQRRLRDATRRGERPGIARARSLLGLLALSEGDAAAAASELREAVRLLDEMGLAHPGAIPALPDAVEALALAGDVDGALAHLGRLEQQAARVESEWAPAAVDRARGAVALARGEAEPAGASLERAAAEFTRLGYRPDAARALLLHGRALLRDGRRTAAGDLLAQSRDEFAAMGAALWVQRAAEELGRITFRREDGQLTPTERRIAALVAQGRKNREIGQELFTSIATVEGHLTRIYRKLGVRSRSELTRMVSEGAVTLSSGDHGG